MYHIMGALAEFEPDLIKDRIQEAKDWARRRRKPVPNMLDELPIFGEIG